MSLLLSPPPLSKSWSLPSASIRDCLGYSPLCPHTVSSSATCSPVYPTRLGFFFVLFFALPYLTLFFLRCVCTLLTSRWFPRQSRSACLWTLSSDGCRTSVSAVWGPAVGEEKGSWKAVAICDEVFFFNRIRKICPFWNKLDTVVIFSVCLGNGCCERIGKFTQ